MTEIVFLPSARTELRAARRYYKQKDAEVARRFSSEVLRLLQRIAEAPQGVTTVRRTANASA